MAQSQTSSSFSEYQHVRIVNRDPNIARSSQMKKKGNENYLRAQGPAHINRNGRRRKSLHRTSKMIKPNDRIFVHLIDNENLFQPAENRPDDSTDNQESLINRDYDDIVKSRTPAHTIIQLVPQDSTTTTTHSQSQR